MDDILPNNEFADGDFQSEPDYDHIREIARGGFGIVYLFRRKKRKDELAEDYCAGKFIYAHLFRTENDDGVAAYQRAFEGLQNFQSLTGRSEDLLKILHVRQRHDEGYFCYMMELADDIVRGREIIPDSYQPRTLKRELALNGVRRRIPALECLDIAVSLARGLQTLHENDFIHRDVRPSNIIFVNGAAKLADIDLLAGNDATLTSYIPREYAAPEASHTKRADIFSFGKTLYEMCMGLPLDSYPRLPPDVRDWKDHKLVLRINKVIAKACAHELRKRYGSAKQLLNDLERIQQGKLPKPGKVPLAIAACAAAVIGVLAFTNRLPVTTSASADFDTTSPVSLLRLPIAASRMPMPPLERIASARQVLEQESPSRFKTQPASEKVQYASSLLNGYGQTNSPHEILARLELARDVAADAGDHQVALQACDRIESDFVIPIRQINAMKAASLARATRAVGSVAAHSRMAEESIRMGFRFLAMDDYDAARSVAETAENSAKTAGARFLAYEAGFLANEVRGGAEAYDRVRQLAQTLSLKPDDSEANFKCGKYLCFFKNAWSTGLPMLAKASDTRFSRVAAQELLRPSSADEQLALADSWWDLGTATKERRHCWERATYWYSKALSTYASSTNLARAEARRAEFFKEVPPAKAMMSLKINVEGGATITINSDEVRISNSYVVRNVRVNEWVWGTLRKGGPHILENQGQTRHLPVGLDFSKASISKKTISNRWGRINKFESYRDRVEIQLGHGPAGAADFEIDISF